MVAKKSVVVAIKSRKVALCGDTNTVGNVPIRLVAKSGSLR